MFLHFETIITICSCRPGGSLGVAEAVPQSLRPYEFSALSLLLMRVLLYTLLTGRTSSNFSRNMREAVLVLSHDLNNPNQLVLE